MKRAWIVEPETPAAPLSTVVQMLFSLLEMRGFDVQSVAFGQVAAQPDAFGQLDLLVLPSGVTSTDAALAAQLAAAHRDGLGVVCLGRPLGDLLPGGADLELAGGGRRVAILPQVAAPVVIRCDAHPVAHGIGDFVLTLDLPHVFVDPAFSYWPKCG